jgi:parallel beta-helix repeat protein
MFEPLDARLLPSSYFVSPRGDDAAAGSAGAPWRTIQRAADVVVAGDTVDAAAGEYAGFQVGASGTAAARIVFHAEPGAVVSTAGPVNRFHGINLEGSSYVTVEGFKVTGQVQAGIRSVEGTGVVIRGNVADANGWWGILTGFSEGVLIEGNTTSNSVVEHGIYVGNSADSPVVRDNVVSGNRKSGIQINSDASQGGDGIITGAVVERNVVYDNGVAGGAALNLDGVQDAVVRNNLLYGNHRTGIALYQIGGAEGSKNNTVVGNTVVQATGSFYALDLQSGSTNASVFDNVLTNFGGARGAMNVAADVVATLHSDYNAFADRFSPDDDTTFLTLAQWRSQTHQDAHSFVATPDQLFVDPGSGAGADYRLRAGSPAIDNGMAIAALSTDLENKPRPLGGGFDVGAFETPAGTPDTSGLPDLMAALPATTPASMLAGGRANTSVLVANRGKALGRGQSSVTVALSTDDRFDADVVLATVPLRWTTFRAGQSLRVAARLAVPPTVVDGTYRLLVVVDPSDSVPEADDGNNVSVAARAVKVHRPVPQLRGTVTAPARVARGRSTGATLRIANVGDGAFSGTVNVSLFSSPDTVAGDDVALGTYSFRVALRPAGARRLVLPFLLSGNVATGQVYLLATFAGEPVSGGITTGSVLGVRPVQVT